MFNDHHKKEILLKCLLAFLILVYSLGARAQTQVTAPLTGTPAAGSYYSYTSIQLNPGFSFTAAAGASLQLSIADPDCQPLASSFSAGQNYIVTSTPRVSGFKTSGTGVNGGDFANRGTCELMQTVQYFDGLGRPLQTVQVKGAPSGKDVVQPYAYDAFGREAVKYLPYALSGTAVNDGSYKADALTAGAGVAKFYNPSGSSNLTQQSNGIVNTSYPFAVTGFEPSPLNRPLEQGYPGAAWQPVAGSTAGHTVKTIYTSNNDTTFDAIGTDSVKGRRVNKYYAVINSNQSRTLKLSGYYAAGTLTVTLTRDENWVSGRAGTVEEYKDNDGHVVLKRNYDYNATQKLYVLSTYYVYDDLGNLAFVLPPSSNADSSIPVQTTLDNLCYQYRYDELGRQSQKKIPGKGWDFTIYNYLDQPVATQDSMQRIANNWIFTKYDALARPVLSGIWNNGNTAISRASLQTTLTGITTNLWETPNTTGNYYTNVAWPTTSVTATLTINYYDAYTNIPGQPAAYSAPAGSSTMTQGLLVASKTAVLNTPTNALWKVNYYDGLGRNIKSYQQHYLGGTLNSNNYDAVTTTYDFTNTPTTVTRKHYTTASTTVPLVTVANTYSYDHMGHKLKTWEQITNGSSAPTIRTLISKIDYNEIGQMLTKHLHSTDSTTFLQNIVYTYNERGWLLSSSAPLFAMQLHYNDGPGSRAWNGNIMYQYWGTGDNVLANHYTYAYDALNRLTSGLSTDAYNENGITYDLGGNITTLNRFSGSTAATDQLVYTYKDVNNNPTNQLQKISDATSSDLGLKHGTWNYTYDANGNLTTDPSKGATGISFGYNLLNLPQTVTGSKTITYTYDAAGQKLRRVSSGTGKTDYIDGIQYDDNGTGTESLSFIQTEEGKAVPDGSGGYLYNYYLGDNLGNTRVSFDNFNGAVRQLQADNYYPFGMEISKVASGTKNEYLYNKKELQEELGVYDYGARFHDPVLGRWTSVDPLAEEDRRSTPYGYTFDDPIRHTDPDGMFGEDANDDGPSTATKVTAGGILGGGMATAGTIAVGGLATGPGEVVALPVAGVVVLGTLAGAGTAWVLDKMFSNHSSAEPKPATLNSSQKDDKKSNVSSGNKNSPHANQKAKQSAQEKYDAAKARYQQLKAKPNKTKADNKELDKAEKEMKHQQQKKDDTGENHSRKAKT